MIEKQPTPVIFAVGYSVRALVEACWYAGFECVAVDHFGDADTRKYAMDRWIEFQWTERGLLSSDTCSAIRTAATEFKRAGRNVVFLLAGGMENLGGAVEQLREIAPVLGPTEEQRRALRDIAFVYDAAQAGGIQTPRVSFENVGDEGWLWKPNLSAGGLKIVRGGFFAADANSGYWQEFIRGEQVGVSCVLDATGCRILCATSSFDAAEWSGPLEFIYRGSIGPIELSAESQTQIEGLCKKIRERIGFFGWLQFDFIRDERGGLWLLECNPRWTAGMEVLLFVGDVNPVRALMESYRFDTSAQDCVQRSMYKFFAKAIVYATESVKITHDMIAKLNQSEGLADRPHAPQLVERGHPIATVRAGLQLDQASANHQENRTKLIEELQERAKQVRLLINW